MMESLKANFEPTDTNLLVANSQASLLTECPILASALSNIFPYLLLMDYFLEIVTWTNNDPYQNFLMVVAYSSIVMYWQLISLVALPILMALAFSIIVWSINSIIIDSKFNEKPTIDEVLHTLHNITIRMELFFRPVKHFPLTKKNFLIVFATTALLTPIHVVLIKRVIGTQRFILLFGIYLLTYHSPWFFSIRRLLWRSVFIRIGAFYLTGLDIKLNRRNQNHYHSVSRIHSPNVSDGEESDVGSVQKIQLLSDFKIIKKSITSPTQLKQVVLFDILENERRWLGIGWAKFLLPSERPIFCYRQSLMSSPQVTNDDTQGKFPFPEFEHDLHTYSWEWMDEKWTIDLEFNKGKNSDGWVYYDNNWESPAYEDGMTKFTRSRSWIRKAILVIDKKNEVQDH